MDDKEKTLERSRVMPMDLTYKKLEDITNSFSEEHKVGSGGYGDVYKGVLDNNTEIAIKKLHQMVGLDDVQFKKEFNNLMRVQHKNIIRLVGYCYEIRHKHIKVDGDYVFSRMEERALCFEYLHRGSLDKYLSGTPGYMPPEYIEKRRISKKFDVFSLGVIIIQIMAGPSGRSKSAEMSPQQFIDTVQENWKRRMQEISSHTSHDEADSLEVKTCIEIAVRCVEADGEKRPTIREIIDKLNEIENVRRALIGQSSGCKLERLVIDPLELRFPFEKDRDVSCVLQLTNRSPDTVAFDVRVNQSKYRTVPDRGVMQPWSRRYIVATLQAQGSAPANLQCDDLFLLRSKRVMGDVGSAADDDFAEDFEKLMDKAVGGEVMRLPVVYIALPPPPSSSDK